MRNDFRRRQVSYFPLLYLHYKFITVARNWNQINTTTIVDVAKRDGTIWFRIHNFKAETFERQKLQNRFGKIENLCSSSMILIWSSYSLAPKQYNQNVVQILQTFFKSH
jgi:hypothetical protein